ncbi:carbohydrate ABC transporter permease [Streptantibioticus cattleyicolor]|uniref:Putative sugar uptake ABC transporter permease protein n=1 Tax=Streptantibioticus cattleyicolor (strain ATCC 35852 / DSM 46488 / JCM 4925 / NBRC 14057 / NRRL 8057) TaxID=1003195 RepID=F8JL40_STREN|nr:sugar ABC transporter permease [Streptantibioticus cattleyicolor]AEW98381.1 putative sugar uptake ABC transporter permease protein [Streptantibioticus cattleyicolor NRRL 8057 = DSM 46488]CCB72560.1 Sugar transporter intracellular portion [Streptantibioticus cattleyicolor NRRL 8057 = DSM 46488]
MKTARRPSPASAPPPATAPLAAPAAPAARPAVRAPLRRRLTDQLRAYGFLLGGLLCFALFSWYPAIRAVVIAFQKYTPGSAPRWVGTANFTHVFADPEFAAAWRNTLVFSLLALVIGFAVPFVMAVVLNELRHARAFFRVVVYLPVMIPPVVSALLWKWFYDPGSGLANEALRFVHLPTSNWTNGSGTALVSLVLVATWANMGGTVLIYLAALQGIPGELYEAAELDGASVWQRLRHVTVPQTRFIILMLLLLQIIATMQVFTEPFVITGGGPENSTITVLYLIYKYAFLYNDFGGACALSVLLLALLGVFSAFYLRLTRSGEDR